MLHLREVIPQCVTLGKPGHVSAAQGTIAKMNERMSSGGKIEDHWISRLPRTFEEEGVSGVQVLRGKPRREMWRFWGKNCAGAMEEAAGMLGMGIELKKMARE